MWPTATVSSKAARRTALAACRSWPGRSNNARCQARCGSRLTLLIACKLDPERAGASTTTAIAGKGRSMDRLGRRRVRELLDRIIDSAPDRHSGMVAHLRFTWSRSPRPMRWLRSWQLCRESHGPRTSTRSVWSTQADLCRDFFCRAVGLKLSFLEAAYTTRVSPDLGTAQLK